MILRVELSELLHVHPQVLATYQRSSPSGGNHSMRVRPVLLFAFILALKSATLAQDAGSPDPQPVPMPNYVVPTGSDPNDSGYTSPILLNYDWTLADPTEDNASLRLEANRQRRSGNPNFIGDMMFEAQQERLQNPQLI